MRKLIAGILLLSSQACGGSATGPGETLLTSKRITAVSRVSQSSPSRSVRVEVTLRNVSSDEVRLTLSADAPIAVRLIPTGDTTPVFWDPPGDGSTRLGLEVILGAFGVRSFERTIPPESLASLAPGTYTVQAVVHSVGGYAFLNAGTLSLPIGQN